MLGRRDHQLHNKGERNMRKKYRIGNKGSEVGKFAVIVKPVGFVIMASLLQGSSQVKRGFRNNKE